MERAAQLRAALVCRRYIERLALSRGRHGSGACVVVRCRVSVKHLPVGGSPPGNCGSSATHQLGKRKRCASLTVLCCLGWACFDSAACALSSRKRSAVFFTSPSFGWSGSSAMMRFTSTSVPMGVSLAVFVEARRRTIPFGLAPSCAKKSTFCQRRNIGNHRLSF